MSVHERAAELAGEENKSEPVKRSSLVALGSAKGMSVKDRLAALSSKATTPEAKRPTR